MTPSGKTITVECSSADSVLELKEKIGEKVNCNWSEQRLIFGGHRLCNECTLSDYNIQKESKLHLVLLLR